jgi:hypothetical protein
MLLGVVLLFRVVIRIFYKFQLAKESSTMEAGVCKESRDLSEDFPFLKGRSLVIFLSSYVFQFDRELGREWFKEVPVQYTQNGKLTCNVAFVLLSRNRWRRVTGPPSTYSARLR